MRNSHVTEPHGSPKCPQRMFSLRRSIRHKDRREEDKRRLFEERQGVIIPHVTSLTAVFFYSKREKGKDTK